MILRPATLEDSDFLFHLRNDPDVMRFSKSQKSVQLAEHSAWLGHAITDGHPLLFIVVLQGCQPLPVGSARIDREKDRGVLSLSLVPQWRGQGIGREVIEKLKTICDELKLAPLAYVRIDNLASIYLFVSAGVEIECLPPSKS